MQQRDTRRLIEIDSLRGLAALWVVLFHFSFGVRYLWLPHDLARAKMVWPFDVNIQGLLAVDMFFMISGFVILMTLERTRSAADFVVARFGRLYPAYWLCLALTTMAIVLIPQPVQSISMAQVLANFTMFNLYFGYLPVESVYWSLAVECAFYGIMLTVFALRWLPHIEALGAVWTLLSALLFTVFPSAGAMLPWRVQVVTILPYASLFYAGILFFRMHQRGPTPVRLGLLAACLLIRMAGQTFVYVTGTVIVFVLFSVAVSGRASFLRWKLLTFLGSISYPLYLIHQSIGFRIQDQIVESLGMHAFVGFAAALVAVVLLSAIVTFGVERRGQRWIRLAYARLREARA